jgi:two-component system NtrC family sensor kinase
MIETAVQKGESLTRQLLSFARRQNLSPKAIDLVDTVRKFSEVLRQSVARGIEIRLELPQSRLVVKVDPNEFEIALLNLTLNARDAMPDGGVITIAVDRADNDGPRGQFAVVTVSDTGTGIAEEIRERIFEPFFTTKQVDKGTGLGLSQVYGFIQQSDGDITVDSKIAVGTTFRLFLPLTDELPQADEDGIAAPARLRRDAMVLLVEDHPDVAAVASDYLTQCGYGVVLAETAEIALEILQRRRDVDLILSDIVMPGISGIEFGQIVRERYPDIPIVLASGYSDKAAVALSEGFRLLQKPYAIDTLRKTLADIGSTSAVS